MIQNIPIAHHGKCTDDVVRPGLAAKVPQQVIGIAFYSGAAEKS
jgi:hypothetical protein